MTGWRLLELRVSSGIDLRDPWLMIVPLTGIECVEQFQSASKDAARLTLTGGRVLWAVEPFSVLRERMRFAAEFNAAPPP